MSYPYSQPGYQFYYPYPAPAPRPATAGTAIAAAVLAIGLGVLTAWSSYSSYKLLADLPQTIRDHLHLYPGVEGVAAALLLTGGPLLLCRLTIGRILVIAGILTVWIAQLPGWLALALRAEFGGLAFSLMFAAMPLPALILAAHSETGRWIRTRGWK